MRKSGEKLLLEEEDQLAIRAQQLKELEQEAFEGISGDISFNKRYYIYVVSFSFHSDINVSVM